MTRHSLHVFPQFAILGIPEPPRRCQRSPILFHRNHQLIDRTQTYGRGNTSWSAAISGPRRTSCSLLFQIPPTLLPPQQTSNPLDTGGHPPELRMRSLSIRRILSSDLPGLKNSRHDPSYTTHRTCMGSILLDPRHSGRLL